MSFFSRRQASKAFTGEIDDAVLTLSKPEAARLEWTLDRRPVRYVFFLALGLFLVLGGRLLYLNVWKGQYYAEAARNNSLRSVLLPAPRGIITDRFGTPLVKNEPSLDAIVIPTLLPSEPAARAQVLAVAERLFEPENNQWKLVLEVRTFGPRDALLIREDITQETAIAFYSQAKALAGIEIQRSARREYINGPIFSHVLGYVGKVQKEELEAHPEYLLTDIIGKQGVEKTYERELRGINGREVVEVDALGRVQKELGVVLPKPGSDITLTLDKALTEKIYTTMTEWFMTHALTKGAAIALDPRDGAVRALVSYPGYDNNLFSGGIKSEAYAALINDPANPLFNRAISGEYAPGSTFKPVVAAAALSERTITPETMIESRGGISVGKFFFGDWKVHGFTDLRRAIAVSSDVYFYSLGGGYGGIPGLGIERMKRYATEFGYGVRTGIDVPGEVSGLIPDAQWKEKKFGERWYVGDDYHAAIGQGFITATPLQIANSIAAIANGGTRYVPHLLDRPTAGTRVAVAPDILSVIREGMRETVTEGTAQSLQSVSVAVAGKTGTAQFGSKGETHGWFVSFAPFTNPELVLIILVEGQAEDSTYHAVPITKTVLEWYFSRENKP